MASLLVSQSAVYRSALENIPMHLVFSRHYSRPVSTEKRLKGQRTHFTLFQFVTLSELRSSCLVCGLSVRTQITLSGTWTLSLCQNSDYPVRCVGSNHLFCEINVVTYFFQSPWKRSLKKQLKANMWVLCLLLGLSLPALSVILSQLKLRVRGILVSTWTRWPQCHTEMLHHSILTSAVLIQLSIEIQQ